MNLAEIFLTLLRGATQTVIVTILCSLTGLSVGLGIAVARRLGLIWLEPLFVTFIYVFRGVPMLVLLFIAFFGLPSIGISVPGHVAMMGSLGLIAGAYLAEIFRGALAGVQHEEVEAALAAGFTRWQALISIEIPQMLRMAVPSMVNEFTTVLKYTPFAYTVGIPEIMKQATAAVSTTLQGVEIYAMAGVLYFVIYRLMLVCVRLADRHFTIPGLSSI